MQHLWQTAMSFITYKHTYYRNFTWNENSLWTFIQDAEKHETIYYWKQNYIFLKSNHYSNNNFDVLIKEKMKHLGICIEPYLHCNVGAVQNWASRMLLVRAPLIGS